MAPISLPYEYRHCFADSPLSGHDRYDKVDWQADFSFGRTEALAPHAMDSKLKWRPRIALGQRQAASLVGSDARLQDVDAVLLEIVEDIDAAWRPKGA